MIPEDVIQETTVCQHDFSCLSTDKCGERGRCEVEYADGKNVLFLVSKKHLDCPYRIPFGEAQACLCPTHYALCQKAS